jgi:PST family polysaccharide transporter
VLTLACILTMPLSLFVAIYATEITLFLFGPAWIEAAPILCVLSFGTFIKQAVGSSAFVLITRGRGRAYLGLTVLHNALLIAAMSAGVQWGVLGVALADVTVTYLMILPRLSCSLAHSPVSVRMFFATLARPIMASLAMSFVLLAVHGRITAQNLATQLGAGVGIAAVVFGLIWLLLPGGKAATLTLLTDLRSAIERKPARLPRVEAVAAAN